MKRAPRDKATIAQHKDVEEGDKQSQTKVEEPGKEGQARAIESKQPVMPAPSAQGPSPPAAAVKQGSANVTAPKPTRRVWVEGQAAPNITK